VVLVVGVESAKETPVNVLNFKLRDGLTWKPHKLFNSFMLVLISPVMGQPRGSAFSKDLDLSCPHLRVECLEVFIRSASIHRLYASVINCAS